MADAKFTIAEWRRLRNLTIEKMADLCDVHPNTIRNWEKKPSIIKLADADKIAMALQVTLNDIIFMP